MLSAREFQVRGMTMTLKKILPLAMTLAVVLPAGQAFAAPKPKFRFQASTYVVAENSASLPVSGQNPVQGSALVTVSRQVKGKNRPTPAITLSYSTSDGSATAG